MRSLQFEEEENNETLEFCFPATVHAESDGTLPDDATSFVPFGKLLVEYEISCWGLDLPARLFLRARWFLCDSIQDLSIHYEGNRSKKRKKMSIL